MSARGDEAISKTYNSERLEIASALAAPQGPEGLAMTEETEATIGLVMTFTEDPVSPLHKADARYGCPYVFRSPVPVYHLPVHIGSRWSIDEGC